MMLDIGSRPIEETLDNTSARRGSLRPERLVSARQRQDRRLAGHRFRAVDTTFLLGVTIFFLHNTVGRSVFEISLADVIDPSKLSGAVKFGAHVKLVDEDTEKETTYQIVGEYEADIENGRLNMKSPIARALIGKDEGDSVEVRTPGGVKSYEILEIVFK